MACLSDSRHLRRSRTGLLPAASYIYDAVWQFLMPAAAALYLLETDLRQLFGSAGPLLLAFALGAVGTLLGAAAAYALLGARLGPDGWKLAAALNASYIGGSVNFAAVAQALGLAAGPGLAAAMAADNLAMAVFLAALMAVPASSSAPGDADAAAAVATAADGADAAATAAGQAARGHTAQRQQAATVTAESVALALAAAAAACALGNSLAAAAGFATGGIACTAAIASAFAAFGAAAVRWRPRRQHEQGGSGRGIDAGGRGAAGGGATVFVGAEALGAALMMVFFAAIGAGAGSLASLASCGPLLAFIAIMCSVHAAVLLLVGRLALRLPLDVLLMGSNCCIGGPATAAAMAGARRWHHLLQPAILVACLGYAVATALSVGFGLWLRAAMPVP
eukprot:scaffold6.g2860.t1